MSMALFKLHPKIYGAWQQEELALILKYNVKTPQIPHELLKIEIKAAKEKRLMKKALK